jgi:hypothetical protein
MYNMSLGTYETGEMGDKVPQLTLFLMFCSTFFNMIVMFNLLVTVIGDVYTDINDKRDTVQFHEKSMLIHETKYLISGLGLDKNCKDVNSYLLVVHYKDSF